MMMPFLGWMLKMENIANPVYMYIYIYLHVHVYTFTLIYIFFEYIC